MKSIYKTMNDLVLGLTDPAKQPHPFMDKPKDLWYELITHRAAEVKVSEPYPDPNVPGRLIQDVTDEVFGKLDTIIHSTTT